MAEELRIDIVADASQFKRELKGAELLARDTGKKLDQDLVVKLELNVLQVEDKIKRVKMQLKDPNLLKPQEIQLRLDLQRLNSQLTESKKNLRDYLNTGEQGLSRFGRAFQMLGNTVSGALKSFVAFSWITAGLALVSWQFAQAQADARAFETAFAGVKKTVETSEQGYKALNNQLKELSINLPITYEELAKIAEAGGQLWVKAKDIATFTETVAKIAVTTNLTSEEAGTAFARIANVLQVPISKIGEMATVVVDLGNNFATTEREIVEFAQRIASGGAVAGVAKEDIFAIATAFSSVGIEAEAGGTAVNKALLGLNEAVVKGGKDLDGFAKVAGLTSAEFKTLFQEDAGLAFTKFVEGLTRSGDSAVTIIENLIGSDVRLKNAFLSVSAGGDILTEAMARANDEMRTQNALNDEATKRFQTKDSKIQMETNELRLQRAELIGNTAQWKIWAMERANNTFAWIGAIRKDYNQFVADGVGVARSINDITDGAKTQAEAMTYLQQEIQRVQDNYDRGRLSVEQYRTTMQELDSNVQQFTGGVQEELIQQLATINQSFLDGSLTAGQYQTQILGVYSEAERLNVGLDRSTAITNGLSQIFKQMSTATSQSQIDALRKRADELTASANNALSVLNRLSGVKVTAPWVQKWPNITGEQAKQSLQQFLEVQKLQAKINTFSENYKAPPTVKSAGWGGGWAKKDPVKEAEKQAKELLEVKEKELRERATKEVEYIKNNEKNEFRRAKKIKEVEERLSADIVELKKWETEAYFDANEKIIKSYEDKEKKATKSIEEIGKSIEDGIGDLIKYEDEIDAVEKKFNDLKESAISDIYDINREITNVGKTSDESLADRYVQVVDAIKQLRDKQQSGTALDSAENAELVELEKEKELLMQNTTEQLRKQAEEYAKMNETQKILLDREKELAILNERKSIASAFAQSTLEDPRIRLQEDTNGVLQAFYEDDAGNLTKIVDDKNFEYARDLLNQQMALDAELTNLKTKKAEELQALKEFNEQRIKLENDYKKVFGESYKYQVQKIDDLKKKMKELIALREQAGVSTSPVPTNAPNVTTNNDNKNINITLDNRSSINNQIALQNIKKATTQ